MKVFEKMCAAKVLSASPKMCRVKQGGKDAVKVPCIIAKTESPLTNAMIDRLHPSWLPWAKLGGGAVGVGGVRCLPMEQEWTELECAFFAPAPNFTTAEKEKPELVCTAKAKLTGLEMRLGETVIHAIFQIPKTSKSGEWAMDRLEDQNVYVKAGPVKGLEGVPTDCTDYGRPAEQKERGRPKKDKPADETEPLPDGKGGTIVPAPEKAIGDLNLEPKQLPAPKEEASKKLTPGWGKKKSKTAKQKK